MAYRHDIGTLQPARKLADGRLRVDGYLTRTGVFEYLNPDGSIRREYRSPEEVFKADSLASFELVPATDDHPPEVMTSQNAKRYAIGSVGERITRDGAMVKATIIVIDAAMVAKIQAGKVALSCGYQCTLVEEPGISPEGERFDGYQTEIIGNHVAFVDIARAGPIARVRMDGASTMVDPTTSRNDEAPTMNLEMALQALGVEKARADAAVAALAAEKTRADTAEGELAAERKRADKADQARKDVADTLGARVQERVALVSAAQPILGADVDLTKMSDRDIKVQVIKKIDGDDIPATAEGAFIDGCYGSVIKRADKAVAALNQVRLITDAGAGNSTPRADEGAAQKAMQERTKNAWKDLK